MAYAAKRALCNALAAQAVTGMPLEDTLVAYAYPGRDLTRKTIYFGGIRTVQTDAGGEWGLVANEVVTIGLYLRVLRPDAQMVDVEQDVEDLADTVADILATDPDLGGSMTWMGITTGNGDYAITPDGPEAVLSLQVMVGAVLT